MQVLVILTRQGNVKRAIGVQKVLDLDIKPLLLEKQIPDIMHLLDQMFRKSVLEEPTNQELNRQVVLIVVQENIVLI